MQPDELLIEIITSDEELKERLKVKIGEAMDSIDFSSLLVENISSTFEAVFENDSIYSMVEESIQNELKKAISAYFNR